MLSDARCHTRAPPERSFVRRNFHAGK